MYLSHRSRIGIGSITPRILYHIAFASLLAWAAGSGYYIARHDQLLASLLGRQARMQYAYEDQIGAMQEALDASGNRSSSDDPAQSARWRDLETRTTSLEIRASRLESLLAGSGSTIGRSASPTNSGIRRADRDAEAAAVGAAVTALEQRQTHALHALLDTTRRTAGDLQAALAALGLAAPETMSKAAMGGPFVPLPADTATFDADLDDLKDVLARRKRFETAVARLPLRRPFDGTLEVTSEYGARRDPFLGRLALHTGIDLRRSYGDPVHAVAEGSVTLAGEESGYGLTVEIDHANGYRTRYAHLSSLSVVAGQSIFAGAIVGAVGTTGRSTGPHLHYEIRIAGEPIDPARYLALAATLAHP